MSNTKEALKGTAPDHAFILAAGKGTRLRPHTDHCPKPLVSVGGRPIIDYTLDRLEEAGVRTVVVNLHHMADKLAEHLSRRTGLTIILSFEEELLDTGGGVRRALPHLGANPFYVIAGDALWTEGPSGSALAHLAREWDPTKMDILTLMEPLTRMTLTKGVGDYDLLPDGRVKRRADKGGAYMWTNIRLNSPDIFSNMPEGRFSFLELMDRAEAAGRFYALIHDGLWHHISTPEDLERVNAALGRPEKIMA